MLKRKRIMLFRATLVLFAIAATCQPGNVAARQIFFGRVQNTVAGKQMKAAFEQEMERIKSVHEQRLATSIEDMKRVCALSDDQVTKLRVASKGAIDKSMKSVRKNYLQMLQQFGVADVDVLNDSDGESDEESEAIDDPNAEEENVQVDAGDDLGILMAVRQNIEVMGGELVKPETEKIWTNAISNTLTEEQSGAYGRALSARTAKWRQAAVEAYVARADAELLLQDSQREELVKLIDACYGAALQKDAVRSSREDFFQDDGFPESKINNDVQKFLSDSQYHVWKSKFAMELEQILERNREAQRNQGGLWGRLFGN